MKSAQLILTAALFLVALPLIIAMTMFGRNRSDLSWRRQEWFRKMTQGQDN